MFSLVSEDFISSSWCFITAGEKESACSVLYAMSDEKWGNVRALHIDTTLLPVQMATM